tara:strand:+ start:48 stop:500 length:453 start_codon:yes stop_codon:yes gene_type:complete
MPKKRKSKRAGAKSGLRLAKPSRSDRILVPGLHRRHIHTQSRPQRNNPYRNTDKTFMRGSLIEDYYMAPIRNSLRAIRGNLTDEDLHILPQRARFAKSFKKRELHKSNSIRTRRNKRNFNKSRSVQPKLKRRKTLTHSKKSRKLIRQSTV